MNENNLIFCIFPILFFAPTIGVGFNSHLDYYGGFFQRNFSIDWQNNRFLMDGKPFRYVAGSMHYFQVPNELWEDRLRKMKFGGLNAVQTYVEWASHEPRQGTYNFDGDNDFIRFLRLAQAEGLFVILRVGPFIDAERDMGGLPPWLLKYPDIVLRSMDRNYINALKSWLDVLLPKIKPLLYNNGGPILMVQIENEYGSYYKCDLLYTGYLRDYFLKILGPNTILFTTDGCRDEEMQCGHVLNVLGTVDFDSNTDECFKILRKHQPKGPLINSEFYVGWFDEWAYPHQQRSTENAVKVLEEILSSNASVSIYMYHGGTNSGFRSGSYFENQKFKPILTSYDFDAPISEAGDLRPKFFALKKYLPIMPWNDKTNLTLNSEKMQLPPIEMSFVFDIFEALKKSQVKPLSKQYPISFEEADHNYGFMLYSTIIDFHPEDPAVLFIPGLNDRAQVFIDKKYSGTLSKAENLFELPILAQKSSQLDVLVENQGRCAATECIHWRKGIVSNVTVGEHLLKNWKIYPVFKDWNQVFNTTIEQQTKKKFYYTPSFYFGKFVLPNNKSNIYPSDSHLRLDGWSKGVAFLNGKNLGQYWPKVGPQMTLYSPVAYFRPWPEENHLVLFELEHAPCSLETVKNKKCLAQFVDHPILNGSTPD